MSSPIASPANCNTTLASATPMRPPPAALHRQMWPYSCAPCRLHCNCPIRRRTPLGDRRNRCADSICSCNWNRPSRSREWYAYQRALQSRIPTIQPIRYQRFEFLKKSVKTYTDSPRTRWLVWFCDRTSTWHLSDGHRTRWTDRRAAGPARSACHCNCCTRSTESPKLRKSFTNKTC